MPFDTLSKMISLHTNTTAVDELNQSLSLGKNRQRAAQIIHSMVYLRNICSHHCRLWNREIVLPPPVLDATAERYGGWGGLTQFLDAEIRAAGPTGIDSNQLTLRAACKFAIPLDGSKDFGRYKDTVGWILRMLRKRRVIESVYASRGGHKPAIWRQREKHDSFEELLGQRDAIESAKNARP